MVVDRFHRQEHARRGGFPANSINVIATEFGPHTAEPR